MNRIDAVVLKRIGGSILLTLTIVFGLLLILESLNWPRYLYFAQAGGVQLALAAMAAAAGRWALRTLSMTVLVGTIIGMLALHARNELNVIKASGHSIWRTMRVPIFAIALCGVGISLFIESAVTQVDRSLNPNQTSDTGAMTPDGAFWIQQDAEGFRYVIRAVGVNPTATVLGIVTIYLFGEAAEYDHITCRDLRFVDGRWVLPEGIGFTAGRPPQRLVNYAIPTTSTAADLRVRMASASDLTMFELVGALASRLSDPLLAAAVLTRLVRLLTLPLLLVGSMLIAVAFTASYRPANKYGVAVLYGMVLGFVVFFVTEMADRAGSIGVLDPIFAGVAPAFVAVVVGLTVLLYREDGRA